MKSIIKLLKEEDLKGKDKLEIFQKYRKCLYIYEAAGTDFSFYLQGGVTSNDSYFNKSNNYFSYWINNDNSGDNVKLYNIKDKFYHYTPDGSNISSVYLTDCRNESVGIRPLIQYLDGVNPIHIKDDLYAYGEYINKKVNMKKNIELEKLFESKSNNLEETGKSYSIKGKKFNEYLYNDKKYVRLDLFNDVTWFEVKPVVCVYSDSIDAYLTKDVIVSGVPYDYSTKRELVMYYESYIFKFLNNVLSKDLVPSKPLLKVKDLELSDYDYDRIISKKGHYIPEDIKYVYYQEDADKILNEEAEEKRRIDNLVRQEVEMNSITPHAGKFYKELHNLVRTKIKK